MGQRRDQGGKVKRYFETQENEHPATPSLRHTARAVLRRKLSITGLCLKNQDKFRRKRLTLPSKELEKRTNKTPSKQKKGKNKRVEINEIESKKQYQRSVKARAGSL